MRSTDKVAGSVGGKRVGRRGFLKRAALVAGVVALSGLAPGGVVDTLAATPKAEKPQLKFGFIKLTDMVPLAIAYEKGYFQDEGLSVTLEAQSNWKLIVDRTISGELDGAHMLAGQPLAATIGFGTKADMVTPFSMDLNGNGITVSNAVWSEIKKVAPKQPDGKVVRPLKAEYVKKVVDDYKKQGKSFKWGVVFPVSTHNYEIRYWMAAAGIDPDRDVQLIVIPPPQMVATLESKAIDGYCVGEPWNARAVTAGIGHTLITSYEIWNNSPEKVFGVNRAWAEKYPNTHRAALMAMIEAAQWMDQPENREEVVRIISRPMYVNAPEDVVKMSMTGTFRYAAGEAPRPLPDFNVFHRYAANFPWRSHAVWFLTQMIRWGQIEQPLDIRATAAAVYRPDLYRDAAKALGVPAPSRDDKTEGTHAAPWTLSEASAPIAMGPDRFFDGRVFDPARPIDYLAGFDIRSPNIALAALAAVNESGIG